MFDAIILSFPTIIKAETGTEGQRIITVEASSEAVDSEGDVILQKALLDSAASFVKTGHIDIDHLSEIGYRLGITNPESFIIGRPIDVKDLGDGRTGVVAELMRSGDGKIDVKKNRFDAVWESLQSDPPVKWRASIYGFPTKGGTKDCGKDTCDSGATRYEVKSIDWRSLALTRNPVNTDLKGYAKIVKAGQYVEIVKANMRTLTAETVEKTLADGGLGKCGGEMKSGSLGGVVPAGAVVASKDAGPEYFQMPNMHAPYSMDELVGQYHRHIKGCHHTAGANTREGFKAHFKGCCGMGEDHADMMAHSLMYYTILNPDTCG